MPSLPSITLIQQEVIQLLKIELAAQQCSTFFGWLIARNSIQWVPLLDFDIVVLALPSALRQFASSGGTQSRFALSGRSPYVGSGPPSEPDPIPPLLAGPRSLQSILSDLQAYSLPPGTISELVHSIIVRSRQVGTARADSLLNDLSILANAPDPLACAKQLWGTGTIMDRVRHVVRDLADLHNDSTFADALLSRELPWDQLVTKKRDEEALHAYQYVLSELSAHRSRTDRQIPNFNDALNVGAAVEGFRARQTTLYAPSLISATERLLDLAPSASRYLRIKNDAGEAPRIVHDSYFLLIASCLLGRSGGSYALVIDEARILRAQAQSLIDIYHVIRRHLQGQSSDSTIVLLYWELLLAQRRTFSERWATTFSSKSNTCRYDVVDRFDAEMHHVFSQPSGPVTSGLLADLRGRLRAVLRDCGFMLSRPPELLLRSPTSLDEPGVISRPFGMFVVPNDGTPLVHSVEQLPSNVFEPAHSVISDGMRVLVSGGTSEVGGILAIEPEYYHDELASVVIVWRHGITRHDLAMVLIEILHTIDVAQMYEPSGYRVKVFTQDGTQEHDVMDAQSIDLANVDYLEIIGPTSEVFADVTDLLAEERQLGVRLAVTAQMSKAIESLANIIAQTSLLPHATVRRCSQALSLAVTACVRSSISRSL